VSGELQSTIQGSCNTVFQFFTPGPFNTIVVGSCTVVALLGPVPPPPGAMQSEITGSCSFPECQFYTPGPYQTGITGRSNVGAQVLNGWTFVSPGSGGTTITAPANFDTFRVTTLNGIPGYVRLGTISYGYSTPSGPNTGKFVSVGWQYITQPSTQVSWFPKPTAPPMVAVIEYNNSGMQCTVEPGTLYNVSSLLA
jgi:hypothetical protein